MEPWAIFSIKYNNNMMWKNKRALLLYGGNIILSIKILVLIDFNHFSLRKTTMKLQVMRHLLSIGGNEEEFEGYR